MFGYFDGDFEDVSDVFGGYVCVCQVVVDSVMQFVYGQFWLYFVFFFQFFLKFFLGGLKFVFGLWKVVVVGCYCQCVVWCFCQNCFERSWWGELEVEGIFIWIEVEKFVLVDILVNVECIGFLKVGEYVDCQWNFQVKWSFCEDCCVFIYFLWMVCVWLVFVVVDLFDFGCWVFVGQFVRYFLGEGLVYYLDQYIGLMNVFFCDFVVQFVNVWVVDVFQWYMVYVLEIGEYMGFVIFVCFWCQMCLFR